MQGDVVLRGLVAHCTLQELKGLVSGHETFPWWSMHQPRLLDDDGNSITAPTPVLTPSCAASASGLENLHPDRDQGQSPLSILFDGPEYQEFHILRVCSLRFRSGQVMPLPWLSCNSLLVVHIISYCLLLEMVPNVFGEQGSSGLWRRVGIVQVPGDCFVRNMHFRRWVLRLYE
jgi:hypothetical protein